MRTVFIFVAIAFYHYHKVTAHANGSIKSSEMEPSIIEGTAKPPRMRDHEKLRTHIAKLVSNEFKIIRPTDHPSTHERVAAKASSNKMIAIQPSQSKTKPKVVSRSKMLSTISVKHGNSIDGKTKLIKVHRPDQSQNSKLLLFKAQVGQN